MRKSQIGIGGIYAAKVSGRIVPVQVLSKTSGNTRLYSRHNMAPSYGSRRVTKFRTRNLNTGREIIMGAARLRRPLRIRDEATSPANLDCALYIAHRARINAQRGCN